jgi:ABC-type multidrug transport system fused ATPase/permease subunit
LPKLVAIEKLSGTRTIIIISHRLSTVKLADSIVLLKDGSVAEKGTFEELMRRDDGIFKSFVMLQQYYGVSNFPTPSTALNATKE